MDAIGKRGVKKAGYAVCGRCGVEKRTGALDNQGICKGFNGAPGCGGQAVKNVLPFRETSFCEDDLLRCMRRSQQFVNDFGISAWFNEGDGLADRIIKIFDAIEERDRRGVAPAAVPTGAGSNAISPKAQRYIDELKQVISSQQNAIDIFKSQTQNGNSAQNSAEKVKLETQLNQLAAVNAARGTEIQRLLKQIEEIRAGYEEQITRVKEPYTILSEVVAFLSTEAAATLERAGCKLSYTNAPSRVLIHAALQALEGKVTELKKKLADETSKAFMAAPAASAVPPPAPVPGTPSWSISIAIPPGDALEAIRTIIREELAKVQALLKPAVESPPDAVPAQIKAEVSKAVESKKEPEKSPVSADAFGKIVPGKPGYRYCWLCKTATMAKSYWYKANGICAECRGLKPKPKAEEKKKTKPGEKPAFGPICKVCKQMKAGRWFNDQGVCITCERKRSGRRT